MDVTTKKKIYVVYDFALDITSYGDIAYRHGQIIDIHHVPSLIENLLFVSQLTKARNIFEFWLDCFFDKYIKKYGLIVVEGVLDSQDRLYKFRDLS